MQVFVDTFIHARLTISLNSVLGNLLPRVHDGKLIVEWWASMKQLAKIVILIDTGEQCFTGEKIIESQRSKSANMQVAIIH